MRLSELLGVGVIPEVAKLGIGEGSVPGLPSRKVTRAMLIERLRALGGRKLTGTRALLWQRLCGAARAAGVSPHSALWEESS